MEQNRRLLSKSLSQSNLLQSLSRYCEVNGTPGVLQDELCNTRELVLLVWLCFGITFSDQLVVPPMVQYSSSYVIGRRRFRPVTSSRCFRPAFPR